MNTVVASHESTADTPIGARAGTAGIERIKPGVAEVLEAPVRLTGARLASLFEHEAQRWSAIDPVLAVPVEALARATAAGGKRLRPTFCYWAFVGRGGGDDDPRLADVCAALELIHLFALVHDDLMDHSELRRGRPTLHRQFASDHEAEGWDGDADDYGLSAALLAGDLALTLADGLLTDTAPPIRHVFSELKLEMCAGQYLDLVAPHRRSRSAHLARTISILKTAKYTVERPLHLGALLRDDDRRTQDRLSAFGLVLGEAFQLLDDVLGIFGSPEKTGKPVGDDLREGKLTWLVAEAWRLADSDGRLLLQRLGAPSLTESEVLALQDVIVRTGALQRARSRLDRLVARAHDALDRCPLTSDAHDALAVLADFVVDRET
jgi:geranylgeranyl diphosphate synthase type I